MTVGILKIGQNESPSVQSHKVFDNKAVEKISKCIGKHLQYLLVKNN